MLAVPTNIRMPNKKLKSGLSTILVILLISAVILLAGVFFLKSSKNTQTNQGSVSPIVSNKVSTKSSSIQNKKKVISYTNPKYKFTIDYPDYLTLTPESKIQAGGQKLDQFSWHTGNPLRDVSTNFNVFDGDLRLFITPAGGYNQFDQISSNDSIEINGEKIPYMTYNHWITLQTIQRNGYNFNFDIYRKDLTNETLLKDFFASITTFKFIN